MISQPRVPFLDKSEVPEDILEIYQQFEEKFGMVPNLVQEAAQSSPGLKMLVTVLSTPEDYELDPALHELAYLRASHVNECEY